MRRPLAGIAQSATARDWATVLTLVLDVIALSALAATQEIHPLLIALLPVIFLASRTRVLRVTEFFLVASFAFLFTGALAAWQILHVHPIIAAAHAAPLCHALIWCAPDRDHYRGWRLAMGFIELILASALTSDFFLSVAIFLFVLLGSVALSCNFLDAELKARLPAESQTQLPESFIRKSLGMAFLVLLSTAVIFPLLPRMRNYNAMESTTSRVGYTEEVNLSQWNKLSGEGEGAAVLRFYSESAESLLTDIYLGLIRAKVLDHFDGKRWSANKKKYLSKSGKLDLPEHPGKPSRVVALEAVRESLPTDVLPVPYGTRLVKLRPSRDFEWPVNVMRSGEWSDPHIMDRKVTYRFEFTPFELSRKERDEELDEPAEEHLTVPDRVRTRRLETLAQKLFEGKDTDRQKLDAVLSWFKREKFGVTVDGFEGGSAPGGDAATLLSPLEQFLFVQKRGHCELFASSTALLLRLAEVPTRLVAGFRISKAPIGGILTLRSGDAHAWVEVYLKSRGWMPVDPTPRSLGGGSPFDRLRDAYELVSGYWSKYILSFNEGSSGFSFATEALKTAGSSYRLSHFENGFRRFLSRYKTLLIWMGAGLAFLAVAAFAAAWAWFPSLFSIRWRVREGPWVLRRERVRMEKLLRRKLGGGTAVAEGDIRGWISAMQSRFGQATQLEEWSAAYQKLRFGPGGASEVPRPEDIEALRTGFQQTRRFLNNSR